MDTDTFDVSDDVLEARHAAARAMLAALKESLPFVASMESPGHLPERTKRVAQWRKLRDLIAQAEAAGIVASDADVSPDKAEG
jgi:hypothetical protein